MSDVTLDAEKSQKILDKLVNFPYIEVYELIDNMCSQNSDLKIRSAEDIMKEELKVQEQNIIEQVEAEI